MNRRILPSLLRAAAAVCLLAMALSCRTAGATKPAGAGGGEVTAAGAPRGLCQNACDKYIACGGRMARRVCVDECTFIFADDESLTSLMAMQCPAYVSYIDGPAK